MKNKILIISQNIYKYNNIMIYNILKFVSRYLIIVKYKYTKDFLFEI